MKIKRAQLTLFVIVSIIIVVAVVGYFVFRDSIVGTQYDESISTLKENLLFCFVSNYENSLETVGFQGGYFQRPSSEYIDSGLLFVPYYYNQGEFYFPELSEVEIEIEKAAESMIGTCVDYYFERDSRFNLDYEDYSVSVKINEGSVVFTTEMKVNVNSENHSVILDMGDASVNIPSNLKSIYELNTLIIGKIKDDSEEWIELTEINEFARENNLDVDIIGVEDDQVSYLFVIKTKEEKVYPSTFQFLNKYKLEKVYFPTGF